MWGIEQRVGARLQRSPGARVPRVGVSLALQHRCRERGRHFEEVEAGLQARRLLESLLRPCSSLLGGGRPIGEVAATKNSAVPSKRACTS